MVNAMKGRFFQQFKTELEKRGLKAEVRGTLVKFSIEERKAIKRRKARAFRLSARAAAALRQLAKETKSSQTDILEKLILTAAVIMSLPEWEQGEEIAEHDRIDMIVIKTKAIL